MSKKKNDETADAPAERTGGTRRAAFLTWAKELKRTASALGAAVALGIDHKAEMTEAEFNAALAKYGSQKSFNN